MKLLKAVVTVGSLTGVSRVLGFIRDIFTAAILGAGPVADAFFVALKLPNFFRRVTAEGAFSVSFVPLYTAKITQETNQAQRFSGNSLSLMFVILSLFTVFALLIMPWIIYVIAPGFHDDSLRYSMAVDLSRITFPYLLFISMTALLGGVLNAHERFAPFAAAPILFNLALIAALLLMSPVMETPGHAMAWGVFAAGVLQFLWLAFSVKKNQVKIELRLPRLDADAKKLLKLMVPGIIGAGVMHINLFADLIIASMLQSGSISYLYYADRLNQLPLGLVGIALGTALLPMLTSAINKNDSDKARNLFNRALELCFFFSIPAAFAFSLVPDLLIQVLFERGEFSSVDTHITSFVLIGYAIGLPAYIAGKVFMTAYWAQHDTKTPVKISIITTIVNIALSLLLIWPMGVAGIAAATGIAGWLQLILLHRKLGDQKIVEFDSGFHKTLAKIILSSFIMGISIYLLSYGLNDLFEQGTLIQIVALGILVLSGITIFIISSCLLGIIEGQKIKNYFKKDYLGE